MSDIVIGVCPTDETAQTTGPEEKQKSKNRFRKKFKYRERKGYLGGKPRNRHFGEESGQHQNGAATQYSPPPASTRNKSSARPAGAAAASQCSSSPSASTFTVNTEGSDGARQKPVNAKSAATDCGPSVSSGHKPTSAGIPTKYLAIDCEMVGAGPKGHISQLARCSVVSYDGDVVYDKFINPPMPITDYRTRWSGIRRSDLVQAMPYAEARKEILKLLQGKVVIGHAVHNDFKVLSYSHPIALTRDTSRIPLLNLKAGFAETECASLKRLTKAIFNVDIQTGKKGHSSVEDARASMELYKVVEEEWEKKLASKSQTR
ncbi:interferon-stimulated 20 kDa exonuclease-like 2 [Embiotoca jacksoni]|uniref:interferon-stimulated 20 kDa exonuclease-like 2 n=1 Tax=Embiotoca jacksoni TaxID=100190 RepID=UPI0037048317